MKLHNPIGQATDDLFAKKLFGVCPVEKNRPDFSVRYKKSRKVVRLDTLGMDNSNRDCPDDGKSAKHPTKRPANHVTGRNDPHIANRLAN